MKILRLQKYILSFILQRLELTLTQSKRSKSHKYLCYLMLFHQLEGFFLQCFVCFCFWFIFIIALSHFVHVVPVLVCSGVLLPHHTHSYPLGKLLPGNYDIFMQANTNAGAGAAGSVINVHISEGGTHKQSLYPQQ